MAAEIVFDVPSRGLQPPSTTLTLSARSSPTLADGAGVTDLPEWAWRGLDTSGCEILQAPSGADVEAGLVRGTFRDLRHRLPAFTPYLGVV